MHDVRDFVVALTALVIAVNALAGVVWSIVWTWRQERELAEHRRRCERLEGEVKVMKNGGGTGSQFPTKYNA